MTILSELATMIISMRGETKKMYDELPTSRRKRVDGRTLRCIRTQVQYEYDRWTTEKQARRNKQ